jgi:hypothetical protein
MATASTCAYVGCMSRRHHRAVVVGGSVAGPLAARVLSDQFAAVAVLERLFPGCAGISSTPGAGNRCNVRLPVAQPHGWGRRHRSGVIRLAFTRDVLDWHVRQHLARYEAVLIQMDAHVVGLLPETACASRTGGAPLPAEADRPVVSSQLTGMTLAGAAEFELAVGSSLVFDPLLVVRV